MQVTKIWKLCRQQLQVFMKARTSEAMEATKQMSESFLGANGRRRQDLVEDRTELTATDRCPSHALRRKDAAIIHTACIFSARRQTSTDWRRTRTLLIREIPRDCRSRRPAEATQKTAFWFERETLSSVACKSSVVRSRLAAPPVPARPAGVCAPIFTELLFQEH